jgi:hypothetical protein
MFRTNNPWAILTPIGVRFGMDRPQARLEAYLTAYTAVLQGAVMHYGVVEKDDDYQRLQKFCERSAIDAAESVTRNYFTHSLNKT